MTKQISLTHHFQAQNRPSEGAVAQQAKPARIGGHVAPDVAAAFGPQIQRCNEVTLFHIPRQALQHTARLTRQYPC